MLCCCGLLSCLTPDFGLNVRTPKQLALADLLQAGQSIQFIRSTPVACLATCSWTRCFCSNRERKDAPLGHAWPCALDDPEVGGSGPTAGLNPRSWPCWFSRAKCEPGL